MSIAPDYSLADIAAATNGGNRNSNGWGGDWSSWIILFLIFGLFGGWGFGGFGGMGAGRGYGSGMAAGAADNYVLATDFATIERKLDGVNNGLCDGFYTTAQQINGVQNTLMQGFAGLNTGMVQQGYETRLGIQGVNNQLSSCCCDIREAISGVNYNNAMAQNTMQRQVSDGFCGTQRQIERGFCDTNYNLATNTTSIVQNAHNDADRIIARIDAMESNRQQERIAQLTADNQALRFAASQQAQNAYLVSQLGQKCPQPAYVVQPPQSVTFPTNCCGNVSYAA